MKLEDIRNEINTIDGTLLSLFERRAALTADVAAYKKEHGMPVFQPEREQEIISRIRAATEEKDAAEAFFSAVMDVSKVMQSRRVGDGGQFDGYITNRADGLPPAASVACQGVKGAYSHIAARRMYPAADVSFYDSFKETAQAVADGRAMAAVMPIENSLAGTILETYDVIDQLSLSIAGAVELPIHHCLLMKEGTDLSCVRKVYSHKAGLEQCLGFFSAHPEMEPEVYSNTAAAAKFVAESDRCDIAAIASEEAGSRYGLVPVFMNVEDDTTNTTRFVILTKKPTADTGAKRVSVKFILPNRKGELYRILLQFAAAGLNLTKLESRPTHKDKFGVAFFLDFEGNILDKETRSLLHSLAGRVTELKLLGSYRIYR